MVLRLRGKRRRSLPSRCAGAGVPSRGFFQQDDGFSPRAPRCQARSPPLCLRGTQPTGFVCSGTCGLQNPVSLPPSAQLHIPHLNRAVISSLLRAGGRGGWNGNSWVIPPCSSCTRALQAPLVLSMSFASCYILFSALL